MLSKLLDNKSIQLRKDILEIVNKSRRGHIGSAFSCLEIIRVLYDSILKFNSKKPRWLKRDRFILSKGHGCLALYVILAEKGFFPKKDLMTFCEKDSILGGHPEAGKVPGVEASTGSLGHGLSIGVGIALSARLSRANFRTYVLLGDGECQEGAVWEAALSARQHHLDNLIVLVDFNKMQSYDTTFVVCDLEPLADKWISFGFDTREVDGHDTSALKKCFSEIKLSGGKPHAVICHTVKGKGVGVVESNPDWHHKSKISDADIDMLYDSLLGII